VIDCGRAWDVAGGTACDVSSGLGDQVVLRGDVLAPATTYVGGEVWLDASGTITCVGCDCGDATTEEATIVTCPDAVVSPGLINPHDHITFTEGAPLRDTGTRYEHRHGWRGSVSTPSNPNGGSSSTGAGNRLGEIRMVLSGVTSMVGSGRATGMVRNLEYSDAREGLPGGSVENDTFPLGDSNEVFRPDCGWYYDLDEWDVAQENAYVPHTSEGIDSYAQSEFFCSSRSTDGAEDYVESNVAHVHAMGLSTVDYYNMARDGSQIIWSPRSNIRLYGMTADVASFHRLGGVIALGTDWTYSGSMNLLRELACADSYNRDQLAGYFTDYELWRMATEDGAIASGVEEHIGRLEVGQVGDVAVFASPEGIHHRAVLEAGVEDVLLVLRGGEALYGDGAVVGALSAGCDPINVCDQQRAICIEREFGLSYRAFEDEVSDSYPAFFCGEPTDEPTCLPSRPGEFGGGSTADDLDDDGLANDEDNCPEVFNPIRPIDGGAQPDADGDGLGDVCDAAPLLADLDGDGQPNTADNCPFDANADQADSDADGKGSVCDVCDEQPNPDGVCPPPPAEAVSVVEVQSDFSTWDGRRVQLVDMVVTGVMDYGFMAQDPSVTDGQWAGVYCYSGSTPTVSRGDQITFEGEVTDYYGETEIDEVNILSNSGPGPDIVPISLTASEAADEMYEGVLVRLTGGEVTNDAFDCGCGDTGLWEIDGAAGVVVFDRYYEDSDWAARTGTLPLTGIMGFRWDRRRVMPRVASDFE
jgi:cytosine/adenosine deaminase-related metal-dependent hydrolase